MKKIQWSTEVRKVDSLMLWKENPRKINKEAFNRLVERIEKHGFHSVIVVDTNNTILSGNQRKEALIKLGIQEVTVLYPNRVLTEDERQKIALESNINDGEWDFEKLKSFDFGTIEFAGFDKITLAKICDEKEKKVEDDNFNVDAELKKIKEPTTKLGDVIALGDHKILCGDSTKLDNLKQLFENDRAAMVYSDPVYNISYNYDTGLSGNKNKKNYGAKVNDTRTFDEYKNFLRDSMSAALAVSKNDLHVFYYCDQIYIGVVQDLYRELGIENKRVALWLKNSQSPVPQSYCNKAYEPAVYGIRNSPHLAESITNLTEILNAEFGTGNELIQQVDTFIEIWTAKRVAGKDYSHATQKPVQLHERPIKRCTHLNDIILDSFLGSGSTLIAAEQLGRRVYGCELEPRFCDLIIRRWEMLTGKKAKIKHYEENSSHN